MLNIKNIKSGISNIPSSNKIFHIIGIGGIGMSAIASILFSHNINVQGSDMVYNNNVKKLEENGIKCMIGEHKKENIENADIIIYSSAIKSDNIEIIEAKKQSKILLSRAEILNHIIYSSYNVLISGMHGKTTTSSMQALIFEYAKIKQIAIIGGIMEYNKSNFISNKNFEWSVIEADESDDTFIRIPSTIAAITNMSPEHLDYHLTFENIKRKFEIFIDNVPFFGFSVVCVEKNEMMNFVFEMRMKKVREIITYAVEDFIENKENITKIDYLAKNIVIHELNHMSFDVFKSDGSFIGNFILNIFGKFNISNALACISISNKIGIESSIIKKALQDFKTTKRRFDIIGLINDNVMLIDDYAHHPNEIDANIETALIFSKKRGGKLHLIIQPHRYSRVQKLFDSFIHSKIKDADFIGIMEIYSAGESEIKGISSESIVLNINSNYDIEKKGKKIKALKSELEMSEFIFMNKSKNDIILFMGAGNISSIAYDFYNKNKSQ